MTNTTKKINSSFRDPSGEVYWSDNRLFRSVSPEYLATYQQLRTSGLYEALVASGLLIPHQDIQADWVTILEPEIIPFISYPYEWCFSAYKDAALVTLRIAEIAIEHGMILKDASTYNIQFKDGKPLLIDTLSFDKYQEGEPWKAYRQFCQHFLAPLALMSVVDPRLGRMMETHIDGIPLDLASHMLPKHKFNFGILAHIHSQAAAQNHIHKPSGLRLSKTSLLGLLRNLRNTVNSLRVHAGKGWSDYKHDTSYSEIAADSKKDIVQNFLTKVKPETVWDMGANDGSYSILAAKYASTVVAFDSDVHCIDACYRDYRESVLSLVLDLTNPSSGIGWAGKERMSLIERGPADLIMALALVHHLAIGNNTPLNMIAEWFHSLGEWLIIERVPKEDPQVQKLLSSRVDIFANYTGCHFEHEFSKYYDIKEKKMIKESARCIYLLRAK